MPQPPSFSGSIPQTYHTYLGPLIFEDYARDIAKRLNAAGNQRILELACGTGIVTRAIAQKMPDSVRLTATDLNPSMLDVCKSDLGSDTRITMQVADACTLPFPDKSFDAVVCQYGVMFFPDKIKAMREARRVLTPGPSGTPGARYIFSVWDSLEHNPMAKTVHETLAGLYPDNPPRFLAAMPYGWSDRTEIERVTRAGGFTRVTLETVGFDCVAPSADDAARAWVEGTPLRAALQERGVTDFAPIRQTVLKALAARFGDKPCRSTKRAIVVTAWA